MLFGESGFSENPEQLEITLSMPSKLLELEQMKIICWLLSAMKKKSSKKKGRTYNYGWLFWVLKTMETWISHGAYDQESSRFG